jgi:hypothetical protein
VLQIPPAFTGVLRLGFPVYFAVLLGIRKILGAIAILLPRFPLLNEWAYAGNFFDLTGAAVASAATGLTWWHVAAPCPARRGFGGFRFCAPTHASIL